MISYNFNLVICLTLLQFGCRPRDQGMCMPESGDNRSPSPLVPRAQPSFKPTKIDTNIKNTASSEKTDRAFQVTFENLAMEHFHFGLSIYKNAKLTDAAYKSLGLPSPAKFPAFLAYIGKSPDSNFGPIRFEHLPVKGSAGESNHACAIIRLIENLPKREEGHILDYKFMVPYGIVFWIYAKDKNVADVVISRSMPEPSKSETTQEKIIIQLIEHVLDQYTIIKPKE